MKFYPTLETTISQLEQVDILPERQVVIQPFIDYLVAKVRDDHTPTINFICTHNSRRSQLAQVWAKTAAIWHGLKVEVFSGGVEVTAFHPKAIEALMRSGFNIEFDDEHDGNPTCFVRFSPDGLRLRTFSKLYNHEINPKEHFAAVMTCSEAGENCPFIPGAEARISLLYEDPKEFDGTPLEDKKYDERTGQIGAELLYAFKETKRITT